MIDILLYHIYMITRHACYIITKTIFENKATNFEKKFSKTVDMISDLD